MAEVDPNTVVVTNISPLLELSHLKELFEYCGPIAKSSLTKDATGKPSSARITFKDPVHATAAVLLSGTPLGDRNLQVVPDNPALANAAATTVTPTTTTVAPTAQPGTIPLVLPTVPSSTTGATLPGVPGLSGTMLATSMKRSEEVARTIYVGNIGPQINEEVLRQFFGGCGEITFVKIAGASDNASRYSFVEFKELSSAAMAMQLTGSMLGDRAIKVGKANNPIVKPAGTSDDPESQKEKIDEAMRKVREAQAKLEQKIVGTDGSSENGKSKDDKGRKRSRSRSRSRGKRDRSRDRDRDKDRHRRRRSRSRSRSRGRYRGRSRSRSPPRGVKRFNPGKKKTAPKMDTTGMFWDGFQWNPIVPGVTPGGPQPR